MKDAKGPMPQRTRERIIQAGLDIFYEKGFNGADIVTIAGKAGVDRTTVLRHFKTMEGLFDAAIDAVTEEDHEQNQDRCRAGR